MSHHPQPALEPPPTAPEPSQVPAAAWALAWSSLAGQLLLLAEVGAKPVGLGMAVSMLVGALLVRWVALGVLTARTGRLVIAWVLLALLLLAYLVEAVDGGTDAILGWPGVHLVAAAASVASLAWFTRSGYFAWQRGRPDAPGPSLAPLVAIAVLVGVLGGVVNTPQVGTGVRVEVNL